MPPGQAFWRGHSAKIAIAAVCTCALASFPAIAASKSSSKSHFPSCASISRTALASEAQTGPLTLKKKVGNLCEFTGQHKGHYEPLFEIQLIPYIKSIWNTAKNSAAASATKNGSEFGEFNSKLFWVSGEITDKDLPPCNPDNGSPGKGDSKLGPVCSPEPTADHFSAYGYGTYKRLGLQMMVSAAVTGERGDVHLSHMIVMVQDILSGKIH